MAEWCGHKDLCNILAIASVQLSTSLPLSRPQASLKDRLVATTVQDLGSSRPRAATRVWLRRGLLCALSHRQRSPPSPPPSSPRTRSTTQELIRTYARATLIRASVDFFAHGRRGRPPGPSRQPRPRRPRRCPGTARPGGRSRRARQGLRLPLSARAGLLSAAQPGDRTPSEAGSWRAPLAWSLPRGAPAGAAGRLEATACAAGMLCGATGYALYTCRDLGAVCSCGGNLDDSDWAGRPGPARAERRVFGLAFAAGARVARAGQNCFAVTRT